MIDGKGHIYKTYYDQSQGRGAQALNHTRWHHDTEHNNTQYNGIQHNDTQHKG